MEYVNYNGQLLRADQPVLKANNRAFKYGDGLFESIRMCDGKLPFLKDHIVRLQSGMHLLKMNIPQNYSTNYFEKEILELASRSDITSNARIRLTVFRKEGGLYSPANNDVEFLIEINPLASSQYIINERGLNIDVFYEVTKTVDKTAILKTCNALPYVLAALYRQKQGLDECIILNTHGRVSDAISSNIFMVYDNKIITPLLSESCIRGIMRNHVLKLAKSYGIVTEEVRMIPEDLLIAEEVFLTNAIMGVQWVEKYRNKTYTNQVACSLVEKVNEYIQSY